MSFKGPVCDIVIVGGGVHIVQGGAVKVLGTARKEKVMRPFSSGTGAGQENENVYSLGR